MTSQDLNKGIDITGLTEVTGSEMNQLVDVARPAADKGLCITTTDTAANVPDVPNPTVLLEGITPTHWYRYIWIRKAFNNTYRPRIYVWDDNATSDATLLKWYEPTGDLAGILADIATLEGDVAALEIAVDAVETSVATANANATTANTAATTAQTTATAAQQAAASNATAITALGTRVTAVEAALASAPVAGVTGIDGCKNLVITNTEGSTTTHIDINADEVTVRNQDGDRITLTGVDLTLDSTAVGANGLEFGAIAADTWYYLWVIYNPTTDTVAGVFSSSADLQFITPSSAWTYKTLVGVVYRQGSNLRQFWQAGKNVWYDPIINLFDGKTSGVANNTPVEIGGADQTLFRSTVPSIAKAWNGVIGMIDGLTSGFAMTIAATQTGLGRQIFDSTYGLTCFDFSAAGNFKIPLKTHTFWWSTGQDASFAGHRIDIAGFEL